MLEIRELERGKNNDFADKIKISADLFANIEDILYLCRRI